jgi:CysZ protein
MRTLTSPYYLAQGFPLLLQPGIRRYVVIPLLINFVLFTAFIIFGISQFSDWVNSYVPTLPDWLQWIEWLLWPLFLLSFIAIGFFVSLLLANLIAAPFNSLLAEAIVHRLRPAAAAAPTGLADALKSIPAELASEIKKLAWFAVRSLPLLVLFVIPGINIVAPVLWLAFSAWVLALENLEFPLATNGLLFDEIRRELGQQRLATLSFGAGVLLITVIPVINFFTIPIAIAGASVFYVEQVIEQSSTH